MTGAEKYLTASRMQIYIAGIPIVYMLTLTIYTSQSLFKIKCADSAGKYKGDICDGYRCRDGSCRASSRYCDEFRYDCTGSRCFQDALNRVYETDEAGENGNSEDSTGTWVPFGDQEYFVAEFEDWSWFQARTRCEGDGGILAIISTPPVNNFILQYLSKNGVSGIESKFWIGLNQGESDCTCDAATNRACLQCRRSWIWYDGTAMDFATWQPDHPSRESCGVLTTTGWMAQDCFTNYKYICQRCRFTDRACHATPLDLQFSSLTIQHNDSADGYMSAPQSFGTDGLCIQTNLVNIPWWFIQIPGSIILRQFVITGILPRSDRNPLSLVVGRYDNSNPPFSHIEHVLVNATFEQDWCTLTGEPLVSGTLRNIADENLSASTELNEYTLAARGRLDLELEGELIGGWCPSWSDVLEPWVQADLIEELYVNMVATQGRADNDQWVKSFAVGYSLDATVWSRVLNEDGNDMIFAGNIDHSSKVFRVFPEEVLARYIRIYPLTWVWNGLCMRFEIYGCAKRAYSVTFPMYETIEEATAFVVYDGDTSLQSQIQICNLEAESQRPADFDECTLDLCQNGASCQDGDNSVTCICAIGFTGDRCEINIDECESGPCRNRAICLDRVNGYSCSCRENNAGLHCEFSCDATIEGSCIWKVEATSMTWEDAEQACLDDDGHLVEIATEFKSTSLNSKMIEQFGLYDPWIGGYQDMEEDDGIQFYWSHSMTAVGSWLIGNSISNPEAQLCLTFDFDADDLGGNQRAIMRYCEYEPRRYAVCEYP